MSETKIALLEQRSLALHKGFLEDFIGSSWRDIFLEHVNAHLTALLQERGEAGANIQVINQKNDIRLLHSGKAVKLVDGVLIFEDGHQVEVDTILQIAT